MLDRTLWIGGPPCAGKTSVARRIARRHGLRLYSADTRTWEHRDRAVALGHPAALRWEALSAAERWEHASVAEMFAMSLFAERGQMVVEDLRRLPDAPLAVAEGSTLPGWAVSAGAVAHDRVLWLIPTETFQDGRLRERGTTAGQHALYRHLRGVIEQEAHEHGVPSITIDGSENLDRVTEAVERRFAAVIEQGPHAEGTDERRQLLREMNLAVVEQIRGYHARPSAVGDAETVVIEAVCECGDPSCEQLLSAEVRAVADALVLAPGH